MSTPRRQTKAQLRATSAAGWAAGETKARIMTLCSREQASQREVMDETLALVARHAQGEQK